MNYVIFKNMSMTHNLQSTLIFIPDISGFTTFINEVDIDHSTHIITELLEIIISSNILKLKVSEIEGDAVFFYRIGKEPSFEEITNQAKIMFLKFHQHLKFYKRDRICQCGACSSAHNLSLKFVYHFGKTTIRKVSGHIKLFGPDVTLAHCLLKNDITEKEYLLLTSLPKYSFKLKKLDWVIINKSNYDYIGIGKVAYYYFSLAFLNSRILELPKRRLVEKYRNPVSISIIINTSLKKVHEVLTNFSLRPKWIFGLRFVKEQSNYLSRIGSKHLCVMPTTSMEFKVTSQNIKKGIIEYVEQSDSIKWLSPLNTIFILKRISTNKTKMIININYKKNLLSKLYFDLPLRLMMMIIAKLSLLKLNIYLTRSSNQT